MAERRFLERYDSASLQGEVQHIERYVLGRLFDSYEQVKERGLQIRGVDYIVRKTGFVKNNGCPDIYVDVKHDHAKSKGDFLYELRDMWGHSWTEAEGHVTDLVLWIKHSEGRAYLIPMPFLHAMKGTELFERRVAHGTGEGAVSKFFRLGTEVKVLCSVDFEPDPMVPMREAMSDERKYRDIPPVDVVLPEAPEGYGLPFPV